MNFINKWKDKIAQSIGDKVQSVKLDIIDKTSGILGYLLFIFVAIFLLLAVLIFLGIGLGEVFSELFDSRAGGFFATAGVYILMAIVLFGFRASIIEGFAGVFIRMLTDQPDKDDENEDEEDNDNK